MLMVITIVGLGTVKIYPRTGMVAEVRVSAIVPATGVYEKVV